MSLMPMMSGDPEEELYRQYGGLLGAPGGGLLGAPQQAAPAAPAMQAPAPQSFGQRLGAGLKSFAGNRDLALALLANSGYGPKQSFGQILGKSAIQADQMQQQRQQDALMNKYRMSQIQNAQRSPYGAIQPDKFTPESLSQFEQTGKYSDLKLRPIGMQTGRYNPGDFTPESWAAFLETNDPAQLVRYVTPQNAVVAQIGGGYEVVQPDKTGRTPPRRSVLTTPEQEREAAAAAASQTAQATAEGEASGAQSGKAPAKASFDIAARNMRSMIGRAMQGMVAGPAGTLFDYGDKKLFESRRQQLSTEIRTVFRIPGEGTLSDQEQQQYGFQLPSTDYPPEVNAAILDDIEARVDARQNTAIGGNRPPRGPQKPKETAAQRAKRLGL